MDETETRLDSLCSKIIESDKTIRFVGVSNKMGNQIISRYRSGLTPLLTPKEIEMYVMESVLRMSTRKDFESKLGKPTYSFTLYQKVKRVTITLESKEYPILMASFDLEADHENIIVNKILPTVNEEGLCLDVAKLLVIMPFMLFICCYLFLNLYYVSCIDNSVEIFTTF
jgi:hypothetical protein